VNPLRSCVVAAVVTVVSAVALLTACHRSSPVAARVAVTETTADRSLALAARPSLSMGSDEAGDRPTIAVDDRTSYQSIVGFGATLTDSSAWLVHDRLDAVNRVKLMQALFGHAGIGLDFLRQPMGATDFNAGRPDTFFSYDDQPQGTTDPSLDGFSIVHDQGYVLPTLREALSINPKVLVMLTAWSAPAWMKTNHSLVDGGQLQPRYYAVWARYYERAIAAYTAAGVPIWATSGQNEPTVGPKPNLAQAYPSMQWTPSQQADFLHNDLQPTLSAAGYHPRILIADGVCFDASYPTAVLRDPANPVQSIAGGIAEHGYCGSAAQLSEIHQRFPQLGVYQTELSPGCQPVQTVDLGIEALRNWAKTVTTWNVALDPSGGPFHAGHGSSCVGLATVDTSTGRVTYNLPYYQEGQFSRYVQRGAVRVASSEPAGSGLVDVALRNPDGQLVLVVHNQSPAARSFAVTWKHRSFAAVLPAGASATYRWAGVT
jgi:O-glycosyl hydrolase